MADTRLLKVQEAEIIEIIRKKGFNPKDFTFLPLKAQTAVDDISSEKILYKNQDYFFHFSSNRKLIFSPGRGFITEGTDFTDWISALAYVNLWLDNLKREVEIIDNWDSIINGSIDYTKIRFESNTKFSDNELADIQKRLKEMQTKLLEMQAFDQESVKIINNNFDYLNESSKRVGRKDWVLLFIGTIITFAPSIFTQENMRLVGHYANEIIILLNQSLPLLGNMPK